MPRPTPESAYPDDAHQSRMDQTDPAWVGPLRNIRNHARHHQGGGTTGEVGGDRPAETMGSPLAPLGDRDDLPGDAPEKRGEVYWDADLTYPISLSHPPRMLRTLLDGADLVSGRVTTIPTSEALQRLAKALVKAAHSGASDDIAFATDEMDRLVRAERLM